VFLVVFSCFYRFENSIEIKGEMAGSEGEKSGKNGVFGGFFVFLPF
jgi:hypothetical protein